MEIISLLRSKFKNVVSKGSNLFECDGKVLFVKHETGPEAKSMAQGQYDSLEAIMKTNAIRVPKPIAVIESTDKQMAALAMEYLNLNSVGSKAKELGHKVARMHLHNIKLGEQGNDDYIKEFGFHMPTCCGVIAQGNMWCSNWPQFYETKLQEQMSLIETNYKDKEAANLWIKLKEKMPTFFEGIEIRPSLLHGDMWSGNIGQADGEAVLIDPGCFYGHHEFDLGIGWMFGLPRDFHKGYHEIIPKEPGFEKRKDLYELFHCLNHWNHFGGGYRYQSIDIMRKLVS